MTAKEFLNRVYVQHGIILRKEARLEELREMSTNVTSTLSDMPSASSPNPQHLEDIMAQIADAERELAEEYQKLAAIKGDIAVAIADLQDGMQIKIMRKRYLELKPWKEIYKDLDVCESVILRRHHCAVVDIGKHLIAS